MKQFYWINTGWGCGGIYVINGVVTSGAPIFRKLFGQDIEKLAKIYEVYLLREETR